MHCTISNDVKDLEVIHVQIFFQSALSVDMINTDDVH